jgi:hypothetical protein
MIWATALLNQTGSQSYYSKLPDCSLPGSNPKTLYKKTLQDNVDDNRLTKQYFPRAHMVKIIE